MTKELVIFYPTNKQDVSEIKKGHMKRKRYNQEHLCQTIHVVYLDKYIYIFIRIRTKK